MRAVLADLPVNLLQHCRAGVSTYGYCLSSVLLSFGIQLLESTMGHISLYITRRIRYENKSECLGKKVVRMGMKSTMNEPKAPARHSALNIVFRKLIKQTNLLGQNYPSTFVLE